MTLHKLAGFPAWLAHEATHAAVAWPFADVDWHLDSFQPFVEMAWPADTPAPVVYAAHLAPTILGLVLTALVAVLAWPVTYAVLPSNPFHAAALGLLLAYNWVLYVWPSYGDRHPFDGVESNA